jgi:NAD(P)-dependent dehydrogenase (short-subunit alcohol dehydrogenase family)
VPFRFIDIDSNPNRPRAGRRHPACHPMPAKKVKEFGSDTAFERAAQPAEIAPIYVFLASQDATYVTGEIYGATGGQTPY